MHASFRAPDKRKHRQVAAMHKEDIKAHIRKAHSSSAAIAWKLHLHPSTVAKVIDGKTKSRRVADEIARVTGLPLAQLWPGHYETAIE